MTPDSQDPRDHGQPSEQPSVHVALERTIAAGESFQPAAGAVRPESSAPEFASSRAEPETAPAAERPFVHDSGAPAVMEPPMIIPIRAYYMSRADDTLRSVSAQFLNTPSRWQEIRSLNAAYPGIAGAGPDTLLPVGSALAIPGDPLPWGKPDPVYLWTLAEKFLYTAWGREPAPEEVVPFWRGLTSGAKHLDMGPSAPPAIGTPADAPAEPPVPPSMQPPVAPPDDLPADDVTAYEPAPADVEPPSAEQPAPVEPEPAPAPDQVAPTPPPPPSSPEPSLLTPEEAAAPAEIAALEDVAVPKEAAAPEEIAAPELPPAAEPPAVDAQPADGEPADAHPMYEPAPPAVEPPPAEQPAQAEPEPLAALDQEAPAPPRPPVAPTAPEPPAPSLEEPPLPEPPSYMPPTAPSPGFEPMAGVPDLGPVEPEAPPRPEAEAPALPAFMPSLTGATPSSELPVEQVVASTQRVLAGTAIGDAMMLWQLGRLRRRRGGKQSTEAPDPLELSLEQTARMDSLRLIEAAMRQLRAVTVAQLRPKPRVVCVRAGLYGFEVLLEQPVEPPEGWQAVSGGYVLELPGGVTAEELDAAGQGPSLCPALVPVGDTAEGPLLLNIEEIGCLAVSGANNAAASLLTSVVETLGSSPLAGDIRIITVGISSPVGPGWERIHATSFDSPQLEHLLSTALSPAHAGAGSVDVLVIGPGNDLLFQRAGQIATTPGSRLVLVGATSSAAARWPWRIHVDEHSRAVVHPIAVNIQATQAMRPELAYLLTEAAEGSPPSSRF